MVTFYYQIGQIWELFAQYLYSGSFLVKIWVFDPLGCPYIGLPSTVLQLILKKYYHTLSWMYFCGYLAWSNGSNCEVICIMSIFGVIFGSKFGFLTIGVPKYRATPTVFQLILNKYLHALFWMYFCGSFLLSNGPNLGVICVITVFGVILGQNWGIWPPGVPLYRIALHCFVINFEETPSCFVLNVFKWLFYMIKLIRLWSYLHNTNIWGDFGQNLTIWPPGMPIYRANPHCCAINFK